MEVRLKRINFKDDISLEDPKDIERVITLEIERRDSIKELSVNNFNNLKYSEEVFKLYDILFDENYMDIVNFLKGKRGRILTNVPYYYDGVWTLLSYDIVYYELDLEHVYTFEEIIALVKVGKIVLLSRNPYISVPYKEEYENMRKNSEKELTTIEEYNFQDTKNNSMASNYLVANMIIVKFNYSQIRESLSEVNTFLIEFLRRYRELCIQLKTQYYGISKETSDEFDKIVTLCDERLEEVNKCKKK